MFEIPEETSAEKDKLTQLYGAYAHTLWYVAVSYVKDNHVAEDLVHEAFMKVATHLNCVGEVHENKTKYFLVTIVKHKCIDYIRKRNRTKESHSETETTLSDPEPLPLDRLILEETYHDIMRYISELDSSYRIPFELRMVHNLDNHQIAEILDMTPNLVAVRISRAKKLIQEKLQKGERKNG